MEFGHVKRSTEELINASVARQKLWMSRMRERGKALLKYLAKHSVKTMQTIVAVTPLVNKLQDNDVSRQSYWNKLVYLLSVFSVLAVIALAGWLLFGQSYVQTTNHIVETEMISEEQPLEAEPIVQPVEEIEHVSQPEPKPTVKTVALIDDTDYTVQKGDCLWDIAVIKFGDGFKYKVLAEYNDITDPDRIYPGQVLKMPR
ncbi:MAG: LysM peptidoglycan-binding domain-containing protein [Alphaproteobacteria bacterium]|nr:LysM peptidoglycan-binding domain-containing protein [Alphaproteobacteria bacterium]